MKPQMIIAKALLIMLCLPFSACGEGKKVDNECPNNAQKIKLSVDGMTCGRCKAKVESGLKKIDGVYSAVVDLDKKEVSLCCEKKDDMAKTLSDAIDDMGYTASSVK